jgi:hypothetical protein
LDDSDDAGRVEIELVGFKVRPDEGLTITVEKKQKQKERGKSRIKFNCGVKI